MSKKPEDGLPKPPSKVTPQRSSLSRSFTSKRSARIVASQTVATRLPAAKPVHYSLFETPIGTCAIVWTETGIRTTHLPEHSQQAIRERVLRASPHARETTPPPTVRQVITDIAHLLSGKNRDLSNVQLDWHAVPVFHRKVYEAVRRIPAGQTMTYGGVARQIGSPNAARAVGQAMARNPLPVIIPCQRVVGSGGKPGGFSAYGGCDTKSLLLDIDKSCAKKSK